MKAIFPFIFSSQLTKKKTNSENDLLNRERSKMRLKKIPISRGNVHIISKNQKRKTKLQLVNQPATNSPTDSHIQAPKCQKASIYQNRDQGYIDS